MEYPKHIFLITVVLAALAGICLMGMGWMGLTGFLWLVLATIPVYWLEIYWEAKARKHLVATGKWSVFHFKQLSLDFFIYIQVLLVFALALPDMLFGMEDLTLLQNSLGLVFSGMLVISKVAKEFPLRQSILINAQKIKITNYGYLRNIDWKEVTGLVFGEGNIHINFGKKKSHELNMETFDLATQKRLLDSLQQVAIKNGLPVNCPENQHSKASTLDKILKKIPKLVIFMLFLVIDIRLVTDLIITVIKYAK